MNVGENIRKFRESKGLSRNNVQELSGVNFRYLGEVERGESNPTIETLLKISQAFNITVSELIGESTPELTEENRRVLEAVEELTDEQIELMINLACQFKKYTKKAHKGYDNDLCAVAENTLLYNTIPILGKVAAGVPIEAIENRLGEVKRSPSMPKSVDYGLIVKGDSMIPVIQDGSVIWVHKQNEAENGEIIIAWWNGEATCKKLYKYDDRIELHSFNNKYKPIVINDGDFKILGKVLI